MAIQRSIEYDVPDRTETVQNIITSSNGIVILLQAKLFASKLRIVCISTPKTMREVSTLITVIINREIKDRV